MEEAVRAGDLKQVQELIQNGEDVNEPCRVGDVEGSPLILAIQKGYKDIALALVAAGADVYAMAKNIPAGIKYTPLFWAIDNGLEEVVQALIDKGSGVKKRNSIGYTPLMVANQRGNNAVSMRLLRAGASCEGLPEERVDDLFRHAYQECDLSAIQALLQGGCSVSILSKEEQDQLLHLTCRKSDVFVARTLLKNGCSVSVLSREEQEQLLHLACHENDMFVFCSLLEHDCSVSNLSTEEQEQLLLLACHESNVIVARSLLVDGCSASSLPRKEQEDLLNLACIKGDVAVVKAFLTSGCNIDFLHSAKYTPLMIATMKGHYEIVQKLILAGANLRKQTAIGNTALHLAASANKIQCGILLAEGGASMRTKNNLSETPLDLADPEFKGAIKHALSFVTRKTLCVIGNAEGGKSTLIASLQAESNSFLGRFINRFRRVSDQRQRTAGIETVPHYSQRYGEVLFFDFAGQDDYHGPHEMFLESLLSNPGISMTLLLVVKMTEEEDAILHQLHRWLTPVALMNTPASLPQVIIVGSFLDKVTSREEATAKLTRCIEATRRDLKKSPLQFVGTSFLNCCKPQSEGIDQLCTFLQEVPVPEFRATHTRYSLSWVLFQIRSFFTAQAVQLKKFSEWVQDNKDNLPRPMPTPEEVCKDLSAAGHALYLPNKEDPISSWLVLDLPSILHDVYGILFQSNKMVREFGLLNCHHLAELFQDLDLDMVKQLLISLEFCLPVDPLSLKVDLSELIPNNEASEWLFFPALISAKPPQSISKGCTHVQQGGLYLCWQLRTTKKHSISARLLQTILLRLVAYFVNKHYVSGRIQQHCCHVWWNGIMWQSTKGVDLTIQITNNRVIQVQVLSESTVSADRSRQYLTEVISDILSTVHRLSPNLEAEAYIVHPWPPTVATSFADITATPPLHLFPVETMQSSIQEHNAFALSLKDSKGDYRRETIKDVFGGYNPQLEDTVRINWPQQELNTPNIRQPDELQGARPLLDVSSTPNMRDMNELIVTPVAANWQSVAIRLGVKGFVSEAIHKNNPNDCEGACRDMLNRWLRRERHTGEEKRTWSTLLTALSRAGFVDLERRLQREHF